MKEYNITDEVIIYNDMPRGWSQGKHQPLWHHKVYDMWRCMWGRVYTDIHWFGSLIDPNFQYLSNYVKWIELQPRFDEFCSTCSKTKWSIDKDSKYLGNRDYYPEYMTLMTQSDNSKEAINRNGTRIPKQPVIGIPLDVDKKIILTLSMKDVTNYGFSQGNVGSCIKKKFRQHKGYKWYKLNYKHDKKYRVKIYGE